MIVREFRKRRGAVFCYWVIIFLVAVSIFAPFLADDQPLAYFGVNRFEYTESRRSVRGLIAQLISPPTTEDGTPIKIDRSAIAENILTRLSDMASHLQAEDVERLRAFREEFQQKTNLPTGDEQAKELRRLSSRLVSEFSARKVRFRSQWHFPVLASLGSLDWALVVFAVLYLLAPLWRAGLRRRYGRMHPAVNRISVGLLLGLPSLVALAAWVMVSPRLDRTPYKEGVLSDAEKANNPLVPVIYEKVMWPPIPFAVDENNLDAIRTGPPWWFDAERRSVGQVNHKPNGLPELLPHWLGTDALGRDILSRMLWGGRVSLSVGIIAVSIYVLVGIVIGAVAGYFRGWTDMVISRFIEVVICFPSFFLILAIVAFVGPSIWNIMVVIGLTRWTGVARLTRGEFLRLSEQEFVMAGRALGYAPVRIIFRHILPNAMAPVLVSATFGIAGAILIESGLSFLGFGITIPSPSWGAILAEGHDAIFSAPWIIYFPGLAIFITITCYNLVGEAFRDASDPRLRGGR